MTAVLGAVSTMVFAVLYYYLKAEIFEVLAITSLTIFYHFSARLLIGYIYQKIFANQINYKKRWFSVTDTEMKFYKTIKIKRWKKYLPTFDKGSFDMKKQSPLQIAMATCQSELVHFCIVLFSFVPLVFSFWFGAFPVFLVTSLISAFIDSLFVMLQRFNRGRIIKILNKKTFS